MVPFTPGLSTAFTAGTTSSTTPIDPNADQVEIQNAGAVTVFVAFGADAATAAVPSASLTAGAYAVLSGQSKIISKPIGANLLAAITSAGTAQVFVTSGQGC